VWYQEVIMADLLIRNVDDDVVRGLDAAAERLGISRNEMLRREMVNLSRRSSRSVTRADWQRVAALLVDLDDPEVMKQAWG
jgi:Antitoxin FitA-like, ribbon-helix-helix